MTEKTATGKRYDVSCILGHRIVDNTTEYLVRWTNYHKYDSWEPETMIGDKHIIRKYLSNESPFPKKQDVPTYSSESNGDYVYEDDINIEKSYCPNGHLIDEKDKAVLHVTKGGVTEIFNVAIHPKKF